MKISFRLSLLWLVALPFLAWPAPSALRAQEAADGTLRMAYEVFPPYSYTNAAGRAEGLSIDLFETLAEAAGYETDYVLAENARDALGMIAAGTADVTSLLALTEERRAAGHVTETLGAFTLQAFVSAQSGLDQLDDLAGLRVGAVAGTYAMDGAAMIPFAQIVEYSDTDALIVPLLSGQIDVAVNAGDSFLARLRAAGVEKMIRPIKPTLTNSPYGFVVAPARPEVQAALDAAIGSALSPEKLELLREIWFGRSQRLTDQPVFWWGLSTSILVAVLLITLVRRTRIDRRTVRALSVENEANTLLIRALDAVSAAIVIFDDRMRAVHWNRGFEENFPGLIEPIKRGATMAELMRKSYNDGSVLTGLSRSELEQRIVDRTADIRNGSAVSREVITSDGTVYEARDFPLGNAHFASIRVDISRLHAQRATITEQTRTLERTNAQLTEFAAIAAHDLRSPLVRQKMLMDLIAMELEKAGITLPGQTPRFWQMTRDMSVQMGQLIEDLLDYAQADIADTRPERVDPGRVLAEIAEFVSPPAGFTLEIAPDLPDVSVNRTAFGTVMRNLLSNAIKHHDRETGHISVTASQQAGQLALHVRDDGPGVPDELKEQVFEPFKRLGSATSGSGLGLAFISRTVEGWGGTVTLKDAPGRGSIFTVTVPMAAADVVPIAHTGND